MSSDVVTEAGWPIGVPTEMAEALARCQEARQREAEAAAASAAPLREALDHFEKHRLWKCCDEAREAALAATPAPLDEAANLRADPSSVAAHGESGYRRRIVNDWLASPVAEKALAAALRQVWSTGDEDWRLVLMSEDGGVDPNPISDDLVDAIIGVLARHSADANVSEKGAAQ